MDILEEDLGEFTKTITEDTTEVVKKQLDTPTGISSFFSFAEDESDTTTYQKTPTLSRDRKDSTKSGCVF